ncbi:MAG: hypothetical protein DBY32_09360 [Phascolarctobacterium sp.]|nr:MAG: hypothetical protein DBY32_09360 [Phascolarctobacterium sp.]
MSKIKEMRKKRNLLQKDVAKKLKINRSTVAKWETGCSVPRTDKLKTLAKIFDCSVDDLI